MLRDTVTVEKFFKANKESLELRLVAGEAGLGKIIREQTVNRPGLVLAGFTKYFASKRVQIMGAAECTFLKSLTSEERAQRYAKLFTYRIPCFVFSRNLKPDRQFLEAAEKARVPIFQCPMITMKFINQATMAIEAMFAPRGTEMGSMVDILGIGVIVKGESGIGKSECVLALLERGYSLVADDITKVSLQDGRDIMGTCSELTRNMMEVRGIGIINVAMMFGIQAIRQEKRVDLVVSLKSWEQVPDVDRLGLEEQYLEILGVKVPHIIIPVRPGRDLARLTEVAAFQTKLKLSGVNAAKDLNERLLAKMSTGSVK
jgi:HPr kinase/phosphorylase